MDERRLNGKDHHLAEGTKSRPIKEIQPGDFNGAPGGKMYDTVADPVELGQYLIHKEHTHHVHRKQ